MARAKAPVRKIKGAGKLGTVANIEKSLKGAGGNRGDKIVTVPAKGVLNVRFLQEPTEFYNYYEYYDPDTKMSYPVVEGEDPPEDVRISKRYMGNVLLTDDKKVRAVIMPSSLFEQIFTRYQKYGTILDRDYELSKTGSGLDTKYLLDFEAASKLPGMNKWQAKMLDLEEVLQSMLDDMDDDEDDDDDDEPESPRSTKKTSRRVVEDDDDDEDEDEDDDDDLDDEDDEDDEPPAHVRKFQKKHNIVPTKKKSLTGKKRK